MTSKPLRAIIPILKGHVIDRTDRSFTIQFGGFRVIVECNMAMLDIHDGDLLTAYTEVLVKKPEGTT